MSIDHEALAQEAKALEAAEAKGGFDAIKLYTRLSGPGWLQGAITLGGGSLAGSLFLGVLAGYSLMWLQPVAMIMGVIMLSAISYVTLSTGKRPFQAINDHINPVLGWGWAIATLMANVVWCLPQFSLGTAAVKQNLVPALRDSDIGTAFISLVLLALATVVIWFYESGSKGVKMFEIILKSMVGVVVLSFFGVVIKMSVTGDGLPWTDIIAGFSPDIGLLSRPSDSFSHALSLTGEFSDFWTAKIVAMQRDVMITAAATAVGINMTFLLPYSMLKKGWGKSHRGLAIFDLSIGLFIPYFLATTCVVIAAASQFHTKPADGVIIGTGSPKLVANYQANLQSRYVAEFGAESLQDGNGNALPAEEIKAKLATLPPYEKQIAAMLVKRDAFDLAGSLEPLTGKGFAQYIFGIGVLGMALSTIIILMLISGFTICEITGSPHQGIVHFGGCMLAGLGVLGPFIWSKSAVWLAVPTSVFGVTLLPIAYLSFLLLMNNKKLMKGYLPQGKLRIGVNVVMIATLAVAAFGSVWAVWSKLQVKGLVLVGIFIGAAIVVHFVRPPKSIEDAPESVEATPSEG